jgi:pimeloyl-ACP methyl ester carboxylesterase
MMILVVVLLVFGACLWAFTALYVWRVEARFPAIGQRIAITPGGPAVHVVERAPHGRERAAVLLIHGASGNFADMDLALSARLTALGFRVFAIDRPGHGWSERLAGDAASSPAAQGLALRAALARRGVSKAIVVGHSLGGVASLALTLEAPDFVSGLVLLAPVSHPWPGGVAWHYHLAASRVFGPAFCHLVVPLAGLIEMRRGVRQVFAPNPVPPDYIVASRTPLVLRPRHFRANAEDVVATKAQVAALSPRYPTISAPTAIVSGDSDGVVYTHIHSVGCGRDIPGASLTMLPGVGHSPHHVAPDAIVAAVLEVEARAAREVQADPGRASAPA